MSGCAPESRPRRACFGDVPGFDTNTDKSPCGRPAQRHVGQQHHVHCSLAPWPRCSSHSCTSASSSQVCSYSLISTENAAQVTHISHPRRRSCQRFITRQIIRTIFPLASRARCLCHFAPAERPSSARSTSQGCPRQTRNDRRCTCGEAPGRQASTPEPPPERLHRR